MGCVSGSALKPIESPTLGKLYSIFNSSIRLLKLIATKQKTLVQRNSLTSPKLPPILSFSPAACELGSIHSCESAPQICRGGIDRSSASNPYLRADLDGLNIWEGTRPLKVLLQCQSPRPYQNQLLRLGDSSLDEELAIQPPGPRFSSQSPLRNLDVRVNLPDGETVSSFTTQPDLLFEGSEETMSKKPRWIL